MYEVWFMDCCGNWSVDEVFDSYEDACDYVDTAWDNLGYEEYMTIEEKN